MNGSDTAVKIIAELIAKVQAADGLPQGAHIGFPFLSREFNTWCVEVFYPGWHQFANLVFDTVCR